MPRPNARGALTLLCLAALCRPTVAQNSGVPLRNTLGGSGSTTLATSTDLGGSSGVTTATSPAIGATGSQTTTIGQPSTLPPGTAPPVPRPPGRPGRALVRQSHQPTKLPVQGQLRPTVPPTLNADVQPPLIGLPAPEIAAAPPRRRVAADDDPFAQIGIRGGGVTYYPSIGESIGYDSNPNRSSSDRKGSFFSQTEAEMRLQSDWLNHELTGYLRGAYDVYPSNSEANRPEGQGRLGLRLDVRRDTQVNIEGHYQIDTQRPDSPDLNAQVRTRPIIATEGGSVGVTQRFNRVLATVQGTVDRSDFENARLTNGTLFDQSDRNLTQYGIRGRLGYEITPGLIPFAEVLADERVYDRKVDDFGYRRSSDGYGGRLGTSFEITRLVTGEISGGAIQRDYDDPRLRNLVSPLVDATLTYNATPLTTVRATGQVTTDETTVAGVSGVLTERGTLEVSHDLRRYWNVTLGVTGTNYDYRGSNINEQSFGATLRTEYKLSRQVALKASYGFEKLWSTFPGAGYTASTFLVGMRYQP